MKKQLLAIVSAICCALSMNAGVIYVKTSPESTAWNAQSTVYTNLESAITAAQAGDEIWLAEGTYYVTNSADASQELLIEKSVSIYGGFVGTETTVTERNWKLHPTIISGDIGVTDNLSDNSTLLINVEAADDDYVLINGVILEKAYGRGGISIIRGKVDLVNCIVRNNYATSYDGGGVYNRYSTTQLINCLIYNNECNRWGGGIYQDLDQGTTTLINCTVVNNHSNDTGGGLFGNSVGNLTVYNSIVWGNTAEVTGDNTYRVGAIEYTCLENFISGTGNISQDPLFVDESKSDFNLSELSPCINVASNDLISENKDLNCNDRILATVDMGAMEYTPKDGVIYVKPNTESSAWSNHGIVYSNLQSAIVAAQAGDEIWLAEGTYYVTNSDDVSEELLIEKSVSIYGGFVGTETTVTERNWNLYPTIISGDIGVTDNLSDNSSLLINVEAADDDYVLINGVILEKAYGRGGISIIRGKVDLVNCIVRNNYATSYDGGGVYNRYSTTQLINCLIYNNECNRWGGGVYQDLDQGTTTLFNCTVVNNHSNDTGGGLFGNLVGNLTVYNSIVWGNTAESTGSNTFRVGTVEYSCLEDFISGTGNIDGNPLFADAAGADYHLSTGSPCIDAASNDLIASYNKDLDFSDRIKNEVVDMGVYESFISTGFTKPEKNSGIKLYPNPVASDGLINIDLENAAKSVSIKIYDLSGKLVGAKVASTISLVSFSLENYNAGIYLVNVQYDDHNYKCKLVVR
nr:T9SS type A sorting domain-containing protein [uncultured Carboxylicivirga sp.]